VITPHCPICEAASRLAFRYGAHSMFRCIECRSAFVSPVPSPEFLEAFYDEYHSGTEGGGEYSSFEDRVAKDFGAKARVMQRVLGHGRPRTLDVGCGRGFFLKTCKDFGWESEGIDLSASAIDFARKEFGLKVHLGRLEELSQEMGKYDAASFWATIEHLPDPRATLSAIHGVLNPGGYLFMDTGIGWDWLDRALPGRTQWYDPPQHLHVFSREGISRLLRGCGFDIVTIDTCFERSRIRRTARLVRAGITAAALRAAYLLSGLSSQPPTSTKFPIGNLMLIVARAKA
jgi:SAM-dependent methyltransferase